MLDFSTWSVVSCHVSWWQIWARAIWPMPVDPTSSQQARTDWSGQQWNLHFAVLKLLCEVRWILSSKRHQWCSCNRFWVSGIFCWCLVPGNHQTSNCWRRVAGNHRCWRRVPGNHRLCRFWISSNCWWFSCSFRCFCLCRSHWLQIFIACLLVGIKLGHIRICIVGNSRTVHQSSAALVIFQSCIGTFLHQEFADLSLVHGGCHDQWSSLGAFWLIVHLGPLLNEDLAQLEFPKPGGIKQRSLTELVVDICVCTCIQQDLDCVHMFPFCCIVQRRKVLLIQEIHLCLVGDKQGTSICLATLCSQDQSSVAPFILGIHGNTCLKGCLHFTHNSSAGRRHQLGTACSTTHGAFDEQEEGFVKFWTWLPAAAAVIMWTIPAIYNIPCHLLSWAAIWWSIDSLLWCTMYNNKTFSPSSTLLLSLGTRLMAGWFQAQLEELGHGLRHRFGHIFLELLPPQALINFKVV